MSSVKSNEIYKGFWIKKLGAAKHGRTSDVGRVKPSQTREEETKNTLQTLGVDRLIYPLLRISGIR